MHAPKTIVAAVALSAVASLSLAACGSSNKTASTPSSPAAVATTPAAALTNLTGTSTAVKLDAGFLAALKSLGLTPGVTGTAMITAAGSAVFPITGGNATYYNPASGVTPYVQGAIMHQGSGLSLTAGATKVTLTNFIVNPGTSMLMGDVAVNGKTALTDTPLFFLDGSNLQPLDTSSVSGSAVLTGTVVKILPAAATLLGTTFKAPGKVPAYLTVGVATITLKLS